MTSAPLADVVAFLDHLLGTAETPDYPGAQNGLQVENRRPIERVAVAVDASLATIAGAIERGASLLVVHHGLFWSGSAPLRGVSYERVRRLVENDVAVYSSHLPLDRHPEVGNNILLAKRLGLEPTLPFAHFQSMPIGIAGECDVSTEELALSLEVLARNEGGQVVRVGVDPSRRTKRWAICTGAGASSDTLREARALGVDTLIVGEGPHHTGVEALETGMAVIYAGHYATETLGVRALGTVLERTFSLPWDFIAAPTGL